MDLLITRWGNGYCEIYLNGEDVMSGWHLFDEAQDLFNKLGIPFETKDWTVLNEVYD